MRKKHDGTSKKLIALLAALGMAMQMAGCGQEETSGEATGDVSVEQTDETTQSQTAGTQLDQTAAGQETEEQEGASEAEEPEFEDSAIEWKNPVVERAVRENVQILTGEIMLSNVRDLTELDLRILRGGAYTYYVTDLSDLAVMPNLEKLTLGGSDGSEQFGLESKSYSIICVDDFSVLSELTALKELDLGIMNLNGTPIKDISSLPSMPNLTSLTVGGEFEDIQVLAGFPNLTDLSLAGYFSDISVLSSLTKLERLSLQVGANNPEESVFDLGALSDLSNLKELNITCGSSCTLEGLQALSGLSNLKELNITCSGNCTLEGLQALSGLTNLESFRLNTSTFNGGYGAHLENLDALSGLSSLKTLEIEGCEIENFSGLSGCSNLISLHVPGEYVESLPDLPNLEELALSGYINASFALPDLSGLKKLSLSIGGDADMSALSNLPSLTELSVQCWFYQAVDEASLPALPNLPKLETLELEAGGNYTSVSLGAFSGLTNLKSLGIHVLASYGDIKDISWLSDMVSLETLDLSRSSVEDLTPLAGLVNLKELDLSGCSNVSDLTPLAGLVNLKRLDLSRCSGINDYSPVSFVEELIQ